MFCPGASARWTSGRKALLDKRAAMPSVRSGPTPLRYCTGVASDMAGVGCGSFMRSIIKG